MGCCTGSGRLARAVALPLATVAAERSLVEAKGGAVDDVPAAAAILAAWLAPGASSAAAAWRPSATSRVDVLSHTVPGVDEPPGMPSRRRAWQLAGYKAA